MQRLICVINFSKLKLELGGNCSQKIVCNRVLELGHVSYKTLCFITFWLNIGKVHFIESKSKLN